VTHGGYWLGWGAITLMTSAYLAAVLTTDTVESKAMFLPGTTTAGHYQIELGCASCHTPFEGVTNDACLACHGEELTAVDDSHPRSKFTDPRNAELVTRLDARRCVTCHREHAADLTRPMGVTLPDDYCYTCHADVGRDRPSHAGMAFNTCASAGCHNYHDNTALYEDFLVAHANEPAVRARPQVPDRALREALRVRETVAVTVRASLASDAPSSVTVDAHRLAEWETAIHARAGVNCTGCHAAASGTAAGQWLDRPSERECASCHDGEVKGFFGGRHGMRVAIGLTRMTPRRARQPMKTNAGEHELSCVSCHQAHDFDTQRAAVEACLGCHDDRHSNAYLGSPHHTLWTREQEQIGASGTGVTCATCHLPRQPQRVNGVDIVGVQHNQNANLRPNEKMTRTVCMNCHGVGFSLGALADPGLIATNFRGRPLRPVAGIEMATTRMNRTSN
jgi:predicted CXXCH cytochrome family protein